MPQVLESKCSARQVETASAPAYKPVLFHKWWMGDVQVLTGQETRYFQKYWL